MSGVLAAVSEAGFDWTDLIPYGSAVIAVAGVVVGQLLGRRSERANWLRNERLAAYAAVSDAVHRQHSATLAFYGARNPTRELGQRINDTADDGQRALARISILGPQDVEDAASALLDAARELGLSIGSKDAMAKAKAEWQDDFGNSPLRLAVPAAERPFLLAARRALADDPVRSWLPGRKTRSPRALPSDPLR